MSKTGAKTCKTVQNSGGGWRMADAKGLQAEKTERAERAAGGKDGEGGKGGKGGERRGWIWLISVQNMRGRQIANVKEVDAGKG